MTPVWFTTFVYPAVRRTDYLSQRGVGGGIVRHLVALGSNRPGWLRLTVLAALGCAAGFVGMASAHAEGGEVSRPLRVVDVGLRPLVSFPEALGLSVEVHPLGGRLSLEGGIGMSPIQSLTVSSAVKFRLPVYVGDVLTFSVGPGVGSHWFFERVGGINGQLLTGFAAAEAVWWGNRVGFRIGLDVGVAFPIRDDPGNGDLHTWPVVNSSIGLAFRTDAGRGGALPPPIAR